MNNLSIKNLLVLLLISIMGQAGLSQTSEAPHSFEVYSTPVSVKYHNMLAFEGLSTVLYNGLGFAHRGPNNWSKFIDLRFGNKGYTNDVFHGSTFIFKDLMFQAGLRKEFSPSKNLRPYTYLSLYFQSTSTYHVIEARGPGYELEQISIGLNTGLGLSYDLHERIVLSAGLNLMYGWYQGDYSQLPGKENGYNLIDLGVLDSRIAFRF